jgi:hypothetical protein
MSDFDELDLRAAGARVLLATDGTDVSPAGMLVAVVLEARDRELDRAAFMEYAVELLDWSWPEEKQRRHT